MEAIAYVEQDVRAGLDSLGFDPDGKFHPIDDIGGNEEFTGDGFTAVPWRFTTRQVREFEGIPPQGEPIVIEGVTIVDDSGKAFRRYIDWVHVMSQLGVTFAGRPTG